MEVRLYFKKNRPTNFFFKSAVHQLTLNKVIHKEKNGVTGPSSHRFARGYIRKNRCITPILFNV